MSLNLVHGFFIAVCIAMTCFTGYWSLQHDAWVGMILSIIGALALLVYFVLFTKKVAAK